MRVDRSGTKLHGEVKLAVVTSKANHDAKKVAPECPDDA